MTVTFDQLGNYGRMGNALFEAAATIGYAKKYNTQFVFPRWNEGYIFNIPDEHFIDRGRLPIKNHYQEKSYIYSEIPYLEDVNLYGYFQSWKYFAHCQSEVRQLLTPKKKEDYTLFRGICGIHVRRGDYLRYPDHHPVQTIDYYMDAIKYIPCKKFLIFSEDVDWCRENFKGSQFVVTDPASAETDFRMLVACNHFVLSNSSFSWWAAWLSEHNDKVVVSPNNWFGRELKTTNPITDLIPPEWIQI